MRLGRGLGPFSMDVGKKVNLEQSEKRFWTDLQQFARIAYVDFDRIFTVFRGCRTFDAAVTGEEQPC